jgi:hypothetical protein
LRHEPNWNSIFAYGRSEVVSLRRPFTSTGAHRSVAAATTSTGVGTWRRTEPMVNSSCEMRVVVKAAGVGDLTERPVCAACRERPLGCSIQIPAARLGTSRNLNTVAKLVEMSSRRRTSPVRGSYVNELRSLGISEYRQIFFKPYRLIYRVHAKQVVVYVVADGRRDMGSLLVRRLLGA